jgi:hypothetical protein
MRQKANGYTAIGNELTGDVMYMDSSGNVSWGYQGNTNSSNFQMSKGSGASSTPYMSVINTATSGITTSASSRFDLGMMGGTSAYVPTNAYLGTLNFMGQANDSAYGGAAIYAYVTSTGGNVARASGHGISLYFATKPTSSAGYLDRWRITPDGNFQAQTADVGIIFANSSATTNSTLNDYETGTWTPTMYSQNSSAYSFSSVTAYGIYTKIGNLVTVEFYVTFSGTRGGAGGDNVGISNLPFTAKSSSVTGRTAQLTVDYGATTDDAAARAGQRITLYQNQALLLFGTSGTSNANSGYFMGNYCQWMITCTGKYLHGTATYEATF